MKDNIIMNEKKEPNIQSVYMGVYEEIERVGVSASA